MLYDKRWDKPEVKPDPLSLESLIAWLETMPAQGEYDFGDNNNCMYCKYFRSVGFDVIACGGNYFRTHDLSVTPFPDGWAPIASLGPHTFGAALERARAAL